MNTMEKILSAEEVFVSNPTGKMHDIPSVTESCLCNPFCAKMSADKRTVCSKCYAQSGLQFKRYAALRYMRNTQLLSESILPPSSLPRFYTDIARFETHGDWVNMNSAMNEIAIAVNNPKTHFTVWTKRSDLLLALAKGGVRQPENFHVMLSSPLLNKPLDQSIKQQLRSLGWEVNYFTVMSLEALMETYGLDELRNRGHEIITCGGRDCRSCMRCYGDHPRSDVVELLKQDKAKAEKLGVKTV